MKPEEKAFPPPLHTLFGAVTRSAVFLPGVTSLCPEAHCLFPFREWRLSLWEATGLRCWLVNFAQVTSVLPALLCWSVRWGYYLPPRMPVLVK